MTGDRDVYLRAIDVLAERGWHQGDLKGPDGSVCVLGAVAMAMGKDGSVDLDRLADAMGTPNWTEWNDDPSRTYEDVILALKRAAAGEAAPCA